MRECKGIGILETALYNADSAARHLDLDEDVWLMIRSPRERIEISENPMLFSGKTIGLKTFVVRHNDALGPAKGGIRMSASVTLDDITGLAMEMTWKTSLIGVPFGGGKAGIRINPAHLSQTTKRSLSVPLRAAPGAISGLRFTFRRPIWEPTKPTWRISAVASPTAARLP